MLRKHFDLPRNSHSTVPVYADECELLVFGAFLNSLPACRKMIFDTLIEHPELFLAVRGVLSAILFFQIAVEDLCDLRSGGVVLRSQLAVQTVDDA